VDDVGGHHGEGQAGAEGDLRCFGVGADVEPGGGVMLPALKQPPPIRTIPATRATMSGARWKAVAMVVRGQRVTVILWVARKARDLLLRGLAVRRRDG
jgi:hypothetical protein